MSKMNDIKKMSDKDLISLVKEKREAVRGSRFNSTARDVKAIRNAKLEIARALTEITMRGKSLEQAKTVK